MCLEGWFFLTRTRSNRPRFCQEQPDVHAARSNNNGLVVAASFQSGLVYFLARSVSQCGFFHRQPATVAEPVLASYTAYFIISEVRGQTAQRIQNCLATHTQGSRVTPPPPKCPADLFFLMKESVEPRTQTQLTLAQQLANATAGML